MKHSMKEILTEYGINLAQLIAGLAGGLLNIKKGQDATTSILAVISGALSANYITPVIVSMLNMSSSVNLGMAFIIGFMGLRAVEGLSSIIMKRLKKPLPETNDNSKEESPE